MPKSSPIARIAFNIHPSLGDFQLLGVLLLLLGWLVFFSSALATAIEIWSVSEYFTHGFFILPLSVFMFWLRRQELAVLPMRPQLSVLVLLLLVVCLAVVATAARVNLVSHLAAFAFPPLVFWLLFGWRAVLRFWFPLGFIFFAVPVGEELIPTLQQVTAKMSASLLVQSGIPVFINGLYIEIPNGRFKVAEACSGLRFLIACTVFGAAYGYFTFRSIWLRCAFLALSVLVPIVANSLRVFGTVLVGHYFGMEHASGVDHIVYGWFFYALVIVCLCLMGEFVRRFDSSSTEQLPKFSTEPELNTVEERRINFALIGLSLILLTAILWQSFLLSGRAVASGGQIDTSQLGFSEIESFSDGWEPQMTGFSDSYFAEVGNGVQLAAYWYAKDDDETELIQAGNRLYDKRHWGSVFEGSTELEVVDHGLLTVNEELITTAGGERRYYLSWYVVNGKIEHSRVSVKVAQIKNMISGGAGSAGIILLSSPVRHADEQRAIDSVKAGFQEHAGVLTRTLSSN